MYNLMGKAALLTSVYFRPVDVIGRPIANKGWINGASLKAAGNLLPGHGLITVSLAFALIGGNKGSEVEWMEGISISITGRGHKVLSNLRLYASPQTLHIHTHRTTHNIVSFIGLFLWCFTVNKLGHAHLLVTGVWFTDLLDWGSVSEKQRQKHCILKVFTGNR